MTTSAPRVGIVGAGYWGPNLIRECARLGVLDAVCDVDQTALNAVTQQYPAVATLSDFDSLLRCSIDAVVIAAPAQLHAPMCLKAIAAGKHVFVEKPLALSVAEGERIAEAAEAKGVSVFVGHLLIYHPGVRKLRSLLEEGAIGRLWHVRSRRVSLGKLRKHEDVWWSFAPHDVALVLAIMNSEPSGAIASHGVASSGRRSDVAYADYAFDDGRTAHLEVCWLDPDKTARLDVFGDTGVLTLTDSRQGSALVLKQFSIELDESGSPTVRRGGEHQVEFVDEDPLKLEMEAFVAAVGTGRPIETSARHGMAVLRALSMADEAARRAEHGAPV